MVRMAQAGGGYDTVTIYEALRNKLEREPTNAELKAEVERIMQEGWADVASKGKLPPQRKR